MERTVLACCKEVTIKERIVFGCCCVCMDLICSNLWKVHANDVHCRWWRCTEIVRWRQFENELNL